MASNSKAATYIELIFSLLIFTMLLIPIGFGLRLFEDPLENKAESIMLTMIRNRMMQASSKSLHSLKERKIVYNKGDRINGFVLEGQLVLDFTHYGQLKQGKSVFLSKAKERYRLSISPVTGFVSLEREE